ncbi:rRNA maturation RNase YbeY [Dyella caseinilytica]|uniref:Endoribonuclease YbeY n=1 Tax=Dyella caseinilytica TaxID=1849581 RepID=A0ABX7GVC3_9GAMM|nr:rRNA maturation RNase YbeY [Dyella caseinilytica]QRN54412.1 rRNA maturation RNase YbeY [Dyella caseinilytica]GFZ94030.1 endoribonuclease YbeY [Dyella caseinilytica]
MARNNSAASSHQVHISYGVARKGLPSPLSFRRWVDAALAGAKRRKLAELSIRIVGTREGRTLNRDYRHKDYATNVLSFPAELPPDVSLPLIGDLAICAPVVAREASEQHKTAHDHWAHMTVHGVLHLLGYDHIEDDEAEAMESLEKRILAKLGIADPYVVENDG